MVPVNNQEMVIEVEEISIPVMAVDMIETCQAEVSTIH